MRDCSSWVFGNGFAGPRPVAPKRLVDLPPYSLLDKVSPRQNTTVFLQIIYTKRVQLVYLGAKMLPQFPLVSLHSYQLINKTVWCGGPWSVALCTYEHTAGTVVGSVMHIRTYAVPRYTPIQPFIYRCIIQNLCNWCIQVPIGYISCLQLTYILIS